MKYLKKRLVSSVRSATNLIPVYFNANELFSLCTVVPLLSDVDSVQKLLNDCLPNQVADTSSLSEAMINSLGNVGTKEALRLAERAIFTSSDETKLAQLSAMEGILNDLAGDEALATKVCEVA